MTLQTWLFFLSGFNIANAIFNNENSYPYRILTAFIGIFCFMAGAMQ